MISFKLVKAFIKGLFTYIPGVFWGFNKMKSKSVHSCSNAEFCYNLWLRIIVHLSENGFNSQFHNIGEIGNGGSLGVGLCALLSGSKKYYALEIEGIFDLNQNLKLLDEIVSLFKNRTPILEKTKLSIEVKCLDYPYKLIDPLFLDNNFVEELRKNIRLYPLQHDNLHFVGGWQTKFSLGLDFIFSRAVLEHVNNPISVYESIVKHMKDEAIMLHDIELHSHGITPEFDGHIKISKFFWKIIYGNREYFLNRWSLNEHINVHNKLKLKIMTISKKIVLLDNGRTIIIGASILSRR